MEGENFSDLVLEGLFFTPWLTDSLSVRKRDGQTSED